MLTRREIYLTIAERLFDPDYDMRYGICYEIDNFRYANHDTYEEERQIIALVVKTKNEVMDFVDDYWRDTDTPSMKVFPGNSAYGINPHPDKLSRAWFCLMMAETEPEDFISQSDYTI
jgi:hypothetical protein